MADYTKSTGTTGTMYIHDNGSTVEFLVDAGNTITWTSSLPWRYTINGQTSAWQSYYLSAGGGLRSLGTFTINTNQTVTFELGATGTSGLGGPTSLSAAIKRIGIPPKPAAWKITSITDTSITGTLSTPVETGGSPLTKIELGYSRTSTPPGTIITIPVSGTYTLANLPRATGQYIWVRYTNAYGTSPWSDFAYGVTYDLPKGGSAPIVTNVGQTTASVSFTPSTNTGGSPILESQIGYGLNPTTPTTTISGTQAALKQLYPGETYYFWGRSRNKFGWGPWGVRSSARMLSGSWIFINGKWVRAVPYVRVSGVWRPSIPLIKIAGLWKPGG